jgi:hypothetical protein
VLEKVIPKISEQCTKTYSENQHNEITNHRTEYHHAEDPLPVNNAGHLTRKKAPSKEHPPTAGYIKE